jgi:hypothetical protein
MTLNLFCISDEELAEDRAALSPADRAAVDILPSSFELIGGRRHSSVDSWRMYQQSKGEAEAAANVLNHACMHAYRHVLVPRYDDLNHPDAQAARILSGLRDMVIETIPPAGPPAMYPPAAAPKRMQPYSGPFPRKRHSHRCLKCEKSGHNSVACYKAGCRLAQTIEVCSWCR